MKKLRIRKNINKMNKLSFRMLSSGLFVFSSSLCALAVNLCNDLKMGEPDLIYRYPPMLKTITYPLIVLIAVALIIDVNEKQKSEK